MISIGRDTTPWDSAEYLKSEEDQLAYLTAVLEEGDPEFFTHALGVIAHARGMTEIASEAEFSRATLCKALGSGAQSEIGRVLGILQALGIKLVAAPAPRTG